MITRYPALWLRDNCACADCRDPRSGQKLFGIADLPADLAVAGTVTDGDRITVTFAPDGHVSEFDARFLTRPAEVDPRSEDAKAAAGGAVAEGSWPRFQADPLHRELCLDAVLRLGSVLLRDVPVVPGTVLDVAAGFGYVRETNYGKTFEVRVEPAPTNLAFTSLAISPHTDNPYRDPVPTVQLLHCLVNDADGGDSGLVDGFAAAAVLRAEDPAAFAVLTTTPVTFQYADADTHLTATRPMIGVDPRGAVREIRFNNRSTRPLRLPRAELDAFYAAYRSFAAIVARPDLRVDFRLAPGDCLVFDNTRMLHARTAFTADGARHLQGCYADLDAVASSLAVLRRDPVGRLAALFAGEGAADYLGEEVTIAEHMLQAAARAREAGADDALVAAALLHDVGHLAGTVTGAQLMGGTDNRHSHTGADWLATWFPPEVTEPVRLHVAAKRYLCAVEPAYAAELSEASRFTLGVQGGPMTAAEVAAFEAEPYARAAVAVRRWDDAAKDPGTVPGGFEQFRPVLERLL